MSNWLVPIVTAVVAVLGTLGGTYLGADLAAKHDRAVSERSEADAAMVAARLVYAELATINVAIDSEKRRYPTDVPRLRRLVAGLPSDAWRSQSPALARRMKGDEWESLAGNYTQLARVQADVAAQTDEELGRTGHYDSAQSDVFDRLWQVMGQAQITPGPYTGLSQDLRDSITTRGSSPPAASAP